MRLEIFRKLMTENYPDLLDGVSDGMLIHDAISVIAKNAGFRKISGDEFVDVTLDELWRFIQGQELI